MINANQRNESTVIDLAYRSAYITENEATFTQEQGEIVKVGGMVLLPGSWAAYEITKVEPASVLGTKIQFKQSPNVGYTDAF